MIEFNNFAHRNALQATGRALCGIVCIDIDRLAELHEHKCK